MSLSIGTRLLLLEQTAIAERVENRIFVDLAPQKTGDDSHVILTDMGNDFPHTLDENNVSTGVRIQKIDIDCNAKTRKESNKIASMIAEFIDDYTGPAGDHTIDAVQLNDIGADFEYMGQNKSLPLFTTTLDLSVIYQ